MTNPENQKLIDYLVLLDRPGRRFHSVSDTRWGGLIEPAPDENPMKTGVGLRIVLFGSWEPGYLALETLKSFEVRFPAKINLIGLVTDDPLDPEAKISIKKRIWGKLDIPERVIDETTIIESALCHGTFVYTGEIKIDSFRRLLQHWNPDAILVCVFGQVIDPFIINLPPSGIYNFHPSDLLHRYGAGPAPYDDLAERRAETTVWTVHHVSEEIDSGHIVGQSPPIFVLNTSGIIPVNPFVVYNKLAEALSPMIFILVNELCRRHELKETGVIVHLDFPSMFRKDSVDNLMKPITRDAPVNFFLRPDPSLFP